MQRVLLIAGVLLALLSPVASSRIASATRVSQSTLLRHSGSKYVPNQPDCNGRYALFSYKANLYVSVRANLPNNPLEAYASIPGGWEYFYVWCDPNNSGLWGFKSYKTNLYASTRVDQPYYPVEAIASSPGGWEEYSLWTAPDPGYIALRSYKANLYVSERDNLPGKPLQALASSIGGWEEFQLQPM